MITSNLNTDSRRIFDLEYSDLTLSDQQNILSLFTACRGALLPFIFIDPAGNMLSNSANLQATAWLSDPSLQVVAGAADPLGGMAAYQLINGAQVEQRITQQVAAPANYHYCFSIYAQANTAVEIRLALSSLSELSQTFLAGSTWSRFVLSGQLADQQASISVSLTLAAGQSATVFGPQLEPQIAPSSYCPTNGDGGVYQAAHFLGDTLTFASDASGLFSTVISVESY